MKQQSNELPIDGDSQAFKIWVEMEEQTREEEEEKNGSHNLLFY